MDPPKRKKNRLNDFDYNSDGYYFITICTKDRKNLLGKVVGGSALDAPKTELSQIGKIVEKYIKSSNNIPGINVDKYVIMPDHIHLLLSLNSNGMSRAPSPTNNAISHTV